MNSKQILLFLQIYRAKLQIKWEKVGVGEGKNECEMQVFSMLLRCVRLPCRYVFVIVANKKTKYTEVHFVILIFVLVKITSSRSKLSRTQQPWGKPSRKNQPSRK